MKETQHVRPRDAEAYANGTWIEPEERSYPGGGMHRRARVMFNGKLRMARAGIPDTYFSIPARCGSVAGWIGVDTDTNTLEFRANKPQA